MTTEIKTAETIRISYKDEVQGEQGELTDFSEGSMHDTMAGAFSLGVNEIIELTISEFRKTFFDTSNGPEVTGGDDDLQILAVDHFGDRFLRPSSEKSTVVLTYSRANTDAGDVSIGIDSVAKTEKDANGEEIRFLTTSAVLLTGLSVTVSAIAAVAGSSGNVDPTLLSVIESPLTDSSVTVSNVFKAAGGVNAEIDAEYRETIRSLIETLIGATKAAVTGALRATPGIEFVSLLEEILPVIEFDIGADTIKAGASFFRIPFPVAYIADINGASSPALLDLANAAADIVRACGVKINIKGAVASSLDWNASLILNPSGPNFATLTTDTTLITDSMQDYMNTTLQINDGFDRIAANNFILSIWGPSGTDDLTAVGFITNVPSGDVAGVVGTKIIAGTMSIS